MPGDGQRAKPEPCSICGYRGAACTCCEGCGHDCPRDRAEPWCPVCFPEGGNDAD